MNQITNTASSALLAGEAGFDPIEERLQTKVRATIQALFGREFASFLGRLRYDPGDGPAKWNRHGRIRRGSLGKPKHRVSEARLDRRGDSVLGHGLML
jgi:hypothetical protein